MKSHPKVIYYTNQRRPYLDIDTFLLVLVMKFCMNVVTRIEAVLRYLSSRKNVVQTETKINLISSSSITIV